MTEGAREGQRQDRRGRGRENTGRERERPVEREGVLAAGGPSHLREARPHQQAPPNLRPSGSGVHLGGSRVAPPPPAHSLFHPPPPRRPLEEGKETGC